MSQSYTVPRSPALPAPAKGRRVRPLVYAVLATIGLWVGLISACNAVT